MDYMPNGSLSDLLNREIKSLCPSDYDNTKRQIVLVGIALGMMTLHNHFVIHRDLKPENILLDEDYHPCVADFGLSKFYNPQNSINQSKSGCGTIAYMAPEVTQSYDFNTKADVYSFGILMYEVVTGSRAYEDEIKKMPVFLLVQRIVEGLRPEFKFPVKKGIRTMIEKCWSSNPDDRPTFREIFLKLSLSHRETFGGFENDLFKSVISCEDSLDFCLDDVDTDELAAYIDEVMEGNNLAVEREDSSNKDDIIQRQSKIIDELKKENENLKREISNLRSALNSKNTNQILSIEQKFDKKANVPLNQKSQDESRHINQAKPPSSDLKTTFNQRINISNSSNIQSFSKQQPTTINVSHSADISKPLSSPPQYQPPPKLIRLNQKKTHFDPDKNSDSDSDKTPELTKSPFSKTQPSIPTQQREVTIYQKNVTKQTTVSLGLNDESDSDVDLVKSSDSDYSDKSLSQNISDSDSDKERKPNDEEEEFDSDDKIDIEFDFDSGTDSDEEFS